MSDVYPATPLGSPPASGPPASPADVAPGLAAAALTGDDRAQVLYGSYRGTCAALPGAIPPPWDKLGDRERAGWRAVARTAFGPLGTLRAERDSYRRLARKVGDVLCGSGTHAAKVRAIWALLEASDG